MDWSYYQWFKHYSFCFTIMVLNSHRNSLARLSFLYKHSALFRLASIIFLFLFVQRESQCVIFFIQLEAVGEKTAMEEEDLRHKLNARLIEHLKGALPSLKVHINLHIKYTSI
jgi:hypothetical protein